MEGDHMNAMALNLIDDGAPRCIYQRPKRPAPVKRLCGPIEEGHLRYQPYFQTPVVAHELPTSGTMHPLTKAIERIKSAAGIRDHIIQTQCCTYHAKNGEDIAHRGTPLELETVAQELHRTGINTVNISSSSDASDDDDDLVTADIAEAHLGITPYEVPDPALMRRIEWEQYILHCSPTTKFQLATNKSGQLIVTSDQPKEKVPVAECAKRAPKLLRALGSRTFADLTNDRERVAFYGGIGSLLYGVANGWQPPIQTLDRLDARAHEKPQGDGGPIELGLDERRRPLEPEEPRLWPVTLEEIIANIYRRLRLSQPEQEWLDTHPEALDTLNDLGLGSYI